MPQPVDSVLVAPAPPPVAFAPPPVEVGQVVLYAYGPAADEKPTPAIVLKVGSESINVAVVVQSQKNFQLMTGVRHADDPFLLKMPDHTSGVWRPTPRDVWLDAFRLDVLRAKFGPEDSDEE